MTSPKPPPDAQITVRFDTAELARLDKAAALLTQRETTRAKQIKGIIDRLLGMEFELNTWKALAEYRGVLLNKLERALKDRTEAMEAVDCAEASIEEALKSAARTKNGTYDSIGAMVSMRRKPPPSGS